MNYTFSGSFGSSSFSNFEKLAEDFNYAYKRAERELEEISQTRLSSSELSERLNRVNNEFLSVNGQFT